MNVQYQQISKIEFKHSYYANNIMRDFSLETSNSAHTQHLVVRKKDNIISLYSSENDQVVSTKMYFPLHLQNSNFLAFTEIPIEKQVEDKELEISGQKQYLFSSISAIEGNIPREECLLVNTRFEVQFKVKTNEASTIKLLDREGNMIYEEAVEVTDIEIGQEKKYLVDVSDRIPSSGVFQLLFDGKQVGKLFVTPTVQQYNGMGILEVDTSKTADYSIQFDSRAIYHRYNLISMDSQKSYTFKIKASDGQAVTYKQEEEKILPNGQASIPILFQEKIALAERPIQTFILEMEESGKVGNIPLPYPDVQNLKRLENNLQGEAYVAEIYIYL